MGIDRPGAERELALTTIARLKADVGQRPWDRESLGTLAVNQWIAGEYDDAQRSFTRTLAMSSDRDTVQQLVALLFRRGRFVKAAAVWKQSGLTDDFDAEQQWRRDFLALYDASLRHAPAAGAIAVPDARLEFRNSIGMTFLPVPEVGSTEAARRATPMRVRYAAWRSFRCCSGSMR